MRTKVDIAIIQKVKELREKHDVSQRVLAEVLNTTQGFIGQVESDKYPTKYSVYQIYVLAEFFECTVSDIYPPISRTFI